MFVPARKNGEKTAEKETAGQEKMRQKKPMQQSWKQQQKNLHEDVPGST